MADPKRGEVWLADWEEILEDTRVQESMNLLWPETPALPITVPKVVQRSFGEAFKVKNKSPDAFVMLIGKALETVCDGLGASKKKTLGSKLKELTGILPPEVIEIGQEIAEIRNAGVHSDKPPVTKEQVEAIHTFFRLVVDYVYVVKPKLSKYKTLLASDSSEDSTVH